MATNLGLVYWDLSRDNEGHREYTARYKVETITTDGPQDVLAAAGLPAIGTSWTLGSSADPWAYCTPHLKVTPVLEEEPNVHWIVEYKFTTLPLFRCQDATIDNPILEPQKVSGSFVNAVRKTTRDRFGQLIKTTSHEPIAVEFDESSATVRIEQNVLNLGLNVFSQMINRVNGFPLWGLGPRKIKLANAPWERKVYGVCSFYYTRVFEFDVNFRGFDRNDIPDRGKKLIRGKWSKDGASYIPDTGASVNNASDFIRAVDKNGNPTEFFIAPNGTPSAVPRYLDEVQGYNEANFLALGIPTVF